jgi:hypothetical protein
MGLLSHRDAGHVTLFRYVTVWLSQLFSSEASSLRGVV